MVRTVSPNAKATPTNPMPSCGKAAASTALPQPPNTSQKVPKNSAVSLRDINLSFTIHPKLLSASYGIPMLGRSRPPVHIADSQSRGFACEIGGGQPPFDDAPAMKIAQGSTC